MNRQAERSLSLTGCHDVHHLRLCPTVTAQLGLRKE